VLENPAYVQFLPEQGSTIERLCGMINAMGRAIFHLPSEKSEDEDPAKKEEFLLSDIEPYEGEGF
jgi:hypothetical protein